MRRFSYPVYRQISSYILFIVAFVAMSYGAHRYQADIGLLVGNGSAFGAVTFILLTMLFVVFIIPLDVVLLIPLGVVLWGPLLTAFMSIAGWSLGAGIVFWMARRWGLLLVTRLVGERRVTQFNDRVPKSNLFWSVVFLRMLIPVDLLSYALGLFSRLSWWTYFPATVLGVSPFGFFFAYVGTLPSWYQFVALGTVLIGVSVVLMRSSIRY
ncbi:MAG: TVP38/TMEM64 family protein [Minisyncoccota bacterium]